MERRRSLAALILSGFGFYRYQYNLADFSVLSLACLALMNSSFRNRIMVFALKRRRRMRGEALVSRRG
jgi:hypothetical protein